MKTRMEIQNRIRSIRLEFEYQSKAYCRMGQIDMQSAEGSQARHQMAKCQGQIEILNWVLENGI